MSFHEPQSIIHKVIRLERKAVKLIKKGIDSASNHSKRTLRRRKTHKTTNKTLDDDATSTSPLDMVSVVTGDTSPATVVSTVVSGTSSDDEPNNDSVIRTTSEEDPVVSKFHNHPTQTRRSSTAFFHSTLDPVLDESMHRESQRNTTVKTSSRSNAMADRHPILEVFASDGEPSMSKDGDANDTNDNGENDLFDDCEDSISDESSNLDGSVGGTNYYGDYRTITQNDLFRECFGGGGMWGGTNSNTVSIIHFFEMDESSANLNPQPAGDDDEEDMDHASVPVTERSAKLDHILENCAQEHTGCKFLRINGKLTPFMAPKLGVRRFPAVVAMNSKGQVLDKLIDFEMVGLLLGDDEWDEEYIEEWIESTTM